MPDNKLMNSLLSKKHLKINGFFTRYAGQNATRNTTLASLTTAVILSVFSSNAVANRPAMDEPSEMANEAENLDAEIMLEMQSEEMQPEQADLQSLPEPQTEAEAPSAVEVMMQQQSQQTWQTQQSGDVLQLPAKEMQTGETLGIRLLDFPRRGMSMDKVKQEYGQPIARSAGIGEPPITHWTYSDRVVYFEYSTVLHVVAR